MCWIGNRNIQNGKGLVGRNGGFACERSYSHSAAQSAAKVGIRFDAIDDHNPIRPKRGSTDDALPPARSRTDLIHLVHSGRANRSRLSIPCRIASADCPICVWIGCDSRNQRPGRNLLDYLLGAPLRQPDFSRRGDYCQHPTIRVIALRRPIHLGRAVVAVLCQCNMSSGAT